MGRDATNGRLFGPQTGTAGDFVFTATQTPHDPNSGKRISTLQEAPESVRAALRTGVLFIDVQSDRVRAQCWRVVENLRLALLSQGSDLDQLVYLRVYLRDITDEPTVRSALAKLIPSDIPAGELVGATN